MKKGFDGARDHHGDLLPELSASATRMKYDKLIDAPSLHLTKTTPVHHSSPNWDISCSGEQCILNSERLRQQAERMFLQTEVVCVQHGTLTV